MGHWARAKSQETHPGIRVGYCARVALDQVVPPVIVIPEGLAGYVADAELEATSGGEVVWQADGEGEAVGRAIIGVLHVAGGDVVEREPVVGRVANGHLLVEVDVGHAHRARDGQVMVIDDAVL